MKNKLMLVLAAVMGGGLAAAGQMAVAPPVATPAGTTWPTAGDELGRQVVALDAKIQTRIEEDQQNGTRATPQTWADIVQGYDAILAAHAGEKTGREAQVAFAKAMLYGGCFNLPEESVQRLGQVIKDYPGTPTAQMAATFIQSFKAAEASLAARRQLVGQPLPYFGVEDVDGNVRTPASYRGKVVLLNYWTSDCARCTGREEMPNVKKAYDKYHDAGFDVLGVCAGAQDREKLVATNKADMPWPEYYHSDGNNALASVPDPLSYPGNYLVGRDGKVVGVDLFGDDLDAAVAKALGAK